MTKQIMCSVGVDVDAVSRGLARSYGGEDSTSDISRGIFAGEVGVPRLVKLFDKLQMKVDLVCAGPFHRNLSDQMKMVASAGHEIWIARLQSWKSNGHDAGAGGSGTRQDDRAGFSASPARLRVERSTLVGGQSGASRSASQEGIVYDHSSCTTTSHLITSVQDRCVGRRSTIPKRSF